MDESQLMRLTWSQSNPCKDSAIQVTSVVWDGTTQETNSVSGILVWGVHTNLLQIFSIPASWEAGSINIVAWGVYSVESDCALQRTEVVGLVRAVG